MGKLLGKQRERVSGERDEEQKKSSDKALGKARKRSGKAKKGGFWEKRIGRYLLRLFRLAFEGIVLRLLVFVFERYVLQLVAGAFVILIGVAVLDRLWERWGMVDSMFYSEEDIMSYSLHPSEELERRIFNQKKNEVLRVGKTLRRKRCPAAE